MSVLIISSYYDDFIKHFLRASGSEPKSIATMRVKPLSIGYKLLLLLCTALLGFALAFALSQYQKQPRQITWLESDDCQLSQSPCYYQQNPYDADPIVLSLSESGQITPMSALKLTLNWPGLNAERLTMSLKGMDMYMGEVRFILQQQRPAHYQSTFYLPVCTTGAMTWQGQIIAQWPGGGQAQLKAYALSFELVTSQ